MNLKPEIKSQLHLNPTNEIQFSKITFDLTARCNNKCRHCFINLPANDKVAMQNELTLEEVERLAGEALELGVLYAVLSGGEPLLHPQFFEIYKTLRMKGFIVGILTNATLIRQAHIDLFKKFKPTSIDISIYGATKETYEKVTQTPNSFAAFNRGVDLLLKNNLPVSIKAIVMNTNKHEFKAMKAFAESHTSSGEVFRYDSILSLRLDFNEQRNQDIRKERLSPESFIQIEQISFKKQPSYRDICKSLFVDFLALDVDRCLQCEKGDICPVFYRLKSLLKCGMGNFVLHVSNDVKLHPCTILNYPDLMVDLRTHSLKEAISILNKKLKNLQSNDETYLKYCALCPIANFCGSCVAAVYAETGRLDAVVPYFCDLAYAKVAAFFPEKLPEKPPSNSCVPSGPCPYKEKIHLLNKKNP